MRAARVSLVAALSTVLSIIFQLISVPVCLTAWGDEAYGSWLALIAAFMLLRSLDSGFVNYVGNRVNILYHQDHDALRTDLASAAPVIALIGLFQFSLAVGALLWNPAAQAMGLPLSETNDLDRFSLLVLTASWVLAGSYIGILHRLLIPAGMMYEAICWGIVLQFLQFAAVISAALLQFDLFRTSLLLALTQAAAYTASALYVKQKLPSYFPWWKNWRLKAGFRNFWPSLALTASTFSQQGATSAVVFALSTLAGPAAVPMYTTVRTLSNLWGAVANLVNGALLEDTVRLSATGQVRKLVDMHLAYSVVVGSGVNFAILISLPALPAVFGYWTAHAIVLDRGLLGLLLAAATLVNAGASIAMHLGVLNRIGIVLLGSLLRGACALGIGTAGYGHLGLAAFGLGILCGELLALLAMFRFFFQRELLAHGVDMPLVALAPAILSTASVLLFCAFEGSGLIAGGTAWVMALAGVSAASAWGWTRLDPEVRVRLLGVVFRTSAHANSR